MILPRLIISKILVKVYNSLRNKSIVHFYWDNKLVSIDGNTRLIYCTEKPKFMLPNLFHCSRLNDYTWKFELNVLYYQLIGEEISCDPNITYLTSRYNKIEDRIRHYVDFVINM